MMAKYILIFSFLGQLRGTFLGSHSWGYYWFSHLFRWSLVRTCLLWLIISWMSLCGFIDFIVSLAVDGVPKEGLRIEDVLVRIAQLLLIRDKVRLYARAVNDTLLIIRIDFCISALIILHSSFCFLIMFKLVAGVAKINRFSSTLILGN